MKPPGSLANWRALDAQLGPDCLRVASYNVHGCVGRNNLRDVGRVAAVIAELGCDTVGLQEVFGARALAQETQMFLVEGEPHKWHDRHVGNALLTRRKVLAVRHHDWSWPDHEPRAALDVDLEVGGETVRIIVTHLGLKPYERRFQVRKILSLLKDTPIAERLVVLGDINEWLPLGRPLRWLNGLLGHSPAERSFPARWPLFALDRVWVRPRHALLAFGAHRSPLAALASDHLPVKAIIATEEARSAKHDRAVGRPPTVRAVGSG
ncbi:MAG TPA: endonuclease/exonuclease/phosphatase family protein [Burkholderiales bacterium]|nr:endonuclease/exonuclease/phosphatase family protein [Burkholderiales bacterium]